MNKRTAIISNVRFAAPPIGRSERDAPTGVERDATISDSENACFA
jgi:hypothetical protein